MPDLLLLCGVTQDWPMAVVEALGSAPAFRVFRAEKACHLEQKSRFDASIFPLDALEALRSAVGYERLGSMLVVADRTDETGRIAAFALGAADCISPDISGAELRARLAGILRRQAGARPGVPPVNDQGGNWYLNLTRHFLVSPNGERIELAETSFQALLALSAAPRRVVSRSTLGNALGSGECTKVRNADVVIARLRQTLGRHDPSGSSLVVTIRNEGYQLARDIRRDEHGIIIFNP